MADLVIPISALEHHAYCPRQCALIHVDGLWFDNEHTVRGTAGHGRVDTASARQERGRQMLRHVPLWSEELGLTGRSDAIEVMDGHMAPVEYKMGYDHGSGARIQLAAQALCLEEMTGMSVPVGYLWHAATRRRQRVPIDEDLRRVCVQAISEVRRTLTATRLPSAPNDSRCGGCQFLDHCLPDLSSSPRLVDDYIRRYITCGF